MFLYLKGENCITTKEMSVSQFNVKPAFYPGGYPCGEKRGYCTGYGTCELFINEPISDLNNILITSFLAKVRLLIFEKK